MKPANDFATRCTHPTGTVATELTVTCELPTNKGKPMTFKIDTKNRAGSAYVAIVADYMERLEIALSDALNDVEALKQKVSTLEAELKVAKRKNGEWYNRPSIPLKGHNA
jgi:hypothetical protein